MPDPLYRQRILLLTGRLCHLGELEICLQISFRTYRARPLLLPWYGRFPGPLRLTGPRHRLFRSFQK